MTQEQPPKEADEKSTWILGKRSINNKVVECAVYPAGGDWRAFV
jgi:hypothetical protein